MSIRYRITLILIAIGLIPMLLLFGLFYFTNKQLQEQAFKGSNAALEEAGQEIIFNTATSAAKEFGLYLAAHPEIEYADHTVLEQNPEVQALAVQAVGKTGYTAIHDNLGVTHFHINPALIDTSLSELAEQFPEFYALVDKSLDGSVAEGYYDWLEPDGVTIRQKYMVIVPVEGTQWRLAATTYIDEFSGPAKTLDNELQATSNRAFLTVLIAALLIAGLSVVIAFFTGRQFTNPISALTEVAAQWQQGNLAVKAQIRSSDEIGKLAHTFNDMSAQMDNLIGSLEQRVAERTQALTTVAEVTSATATILETDRLLQTVVDLTKERFNLYHSHIYLLDEAKEHLVLAAGSGEPGRQMVARGHAIPLSREDSLVARAAREQQGVTVNDVTQEPDFLPNPLLPKTHSELAAPMLVGTELVGVFDIQSEQVGRFTESDIAIQTTLAAQIATSIQNARLYSQAEASQQEAQSLVDYASEAIVVLDMSTGLFEEPNQSAVDLYKLPREALLKVGPAQMSPPKQPDGQDSAEKALEYASQALQGIPQAFDWVHRDATGADILCEVRLVRMPGVRPRLRVTVTDITERKRAEELARRRAAYQETLSAIVQKIRGTATVEDALQITARELGHALGQKPTLVALQPQAEEERPMID